MDNATALQTLEALAEQPLPRFLSLVSPNAVRLDPNLRPLALSALQEADNRLRPASRDDFRRELTACLALVAPTGMAQDDRNEWLRVAWGTLENIPADLLKIGCGSARQKCDHPAKVVPAIMATISDLWEHRRANKSSVLAALRKLNEPAPEPEEPRCTPEEAKAIREALGIKLDPDKPDTAHRGKPIAPDAEWYRAHGIDIQAQERAA